MPLALGVYEHFRCTSLLLAVTVPVSREAFRSLWLATVTTSESSSQLHIKR